MWIWNRYVSQGRAILQPHHLLDELNNIADENKVADIKESAFGKLLQNCQVEKISHLSKIHTFPLYLLLFLVLNICCSRENTNNWSYFDTTFNVPSDQHSCQHSFNFWFYFQNKCFSCCSKRYIVVCRLADVVGRLDSSVKYDGLIQTINFEAMPNRVIVQRCFKHVIEHFGWSLV